MDISGKYDIIYADPPWDYAGKTQHNDKVGVKSAHDHYPCMTLTELKKLNVKDIANRNSILFLWTSSPHLPQALELMKSWGFEYKTIGFVWDKQRTNPGSYTLSQVEICLLGKRGIIPRPFNRNQRQFLSSLREKHSKKPDEIRDRITRMFPSQKKIELFARKQVDDWDYWGNEIKTADV
jgi:N6-adenosine-specific RNA methylase IME4